MYSKNTLITIVGATAIGKTSMSIAIAKHFGCEIISSDSRQFYKEMYIGSAVPSPEELEEVPHHFIQNRSIHEDYNVGRFEKDALHKLDRLFKENNKVVMVGGSGLYVDAVLKGLDYFPKVKSEVRKQLNQQLDEKGIENLQTQLKQLDPETFNTIDIQNPHRVIRALEICIGAGEKYSYFKKKPKRTRNFTSVLIGLDAPREIIYNRIEKRVDIMIANGLLDEAKELYPFKKLNALQTVGYRELFAHFDGKFSFNFSISEIKKNTRRFAKRQNTWFKKNKEIAWFDFNDTPEKVIDFIQKSNSQL